ncbi:tyrosine-type recombinase/integrase [Rhizobium lusitanum]|uniref:tyrosine-type recombinase/integrase n=1 Tax=Rhizobium lusitanum TaxID=293958 RepID=UPI0032B15D99
MTSFAKDLASGWHPDSLDDEGADVSERQPQTVGNYMSHLGSIFAISKAMWGYELSEEHFKDAMKVMKRLGIIGRSFKRNRRPTIKELEVLLSFFYDRCKRSTEAAPMHKIILFAIFSTRRQEEITKILWDDLDRDNLEVLVRDMKHPGEKVGNDVRCSLTPEALLIIDSMPKIAPQIFPFHPGTISGNFTDVCKLLGIEDLHFHDLRHDGISRLFEIGLDIPRVAMVSAHRSWNSLKRYTHIRQSGDKYADFHWMTTIKDEAALVGQSELRARKNLGRGVRYVQRDASPAETIGGERERISGIASRKSTFFSGRNESLPERLISDSVIRE